MEYIRFVKHIYKASRLGLYDIRENWSIYRWSCHSHCHCRRVDLSSPPSISNIENEWRRFADLLIRTALEVLSCWKLLKKVPDLLIRTALEVLSLLEKWSPRVGVMKHNIERSQPNKMLIDGTSKGQAEEVTKLYRQKKRKTSI